MVRPLAWFHLRQKHFAYLLVAAVSVFLWYWLFRLLASFL